MMKNTNKIKIALIFLLLIDTVFSGISLFLHVDLVNKSNNLHQIALQIKDFISESEKYSLDNIHFVSPKADVDYDLSQYPEWDITPTGKTIGPDIYDKQPDFIQVTDEHQMIGSVRKEDDNFFNAGDEIALFGKDGSSIIGRYIIPE